jgi:hypothetical protein
MSTKTENVMHLNGDSHTNYVSQPLFNGKFIENIGWF